MDRVYSVEDIADSFWTENTGGLNRNSSEWLLQRFIQDDSPSASSSSPRNKVAYASSSDLSKVGEGAPASKGTLEGGNPKMVAPGVSAPMDTSEYQAMILKQRLDLACAAVALARASGSKSHESSLAVNGHHDTERSDLCSQSTGKGLPRSQDNRVASPVGIPSLPLIQKNQVSQVKVTTSGSSREQSDDELEGEIEMNEKMDPADAKRMRRMLSNRESARRSRRRKQAHLSELETQVSHLRVENSSLMKRLTDINQKYSEAAVDNRILKADVETLRAKVKMAEETVKRVTGVGSGPLFQTMSGLSSASMQSSSSPSDNAADSVVLVQDEPKHFYQPIHHHVQGLNNGITDITNGCEDVHNLIGKTHRTPSLQRVASLEHLQKRIRGGASAGPPAPWEDGWDPESTNTANDIDKPSKP